MRVSDSSELPFAFELAKVLGLKALERAWVVVLDAAESGGTLRHDTLQSLKRIEFFARLVRDGYAFTDEAERHELADQVDEALTLLRAELTDAAKLLRP